jgi:predicted lipoprotein with Yx(FWY)xxD motif
MKILSVLVLGLAVAGCDDAYAAGSYGYGNSTDAAVITLASGHAALTDSKGMTLYTFDKDDAGASNCNGGCAQKWPPFMAKAGATAPAAGFTIITRDDGTTQWAKNGAPLYYWIGDKKAGDTTGDGVGGVWHTAH